MKLVGFKMPDPPPGFIDNVVIGTVHMHVLRGVKGDVTDLIQTSFTEKEVYDALSELHAFIDFDAPGGHHTTMERTAVSLYSKELVELVWKLDKEKVMPRVVVSSHLLVKIPIGKSGLRPSDVVPLSSRMDSLEKVVEKLSLSLITFTDKMSSVHPSGGAVKATFVGAAGGHGQVLSGNVNGQGAGPPAVSLEVPTASAPTWAEVMASQEQPIRTGTPGAGPGAGPAAAGVAGTGGVRAERFRQRLGSKRKADDETGDGYQQVPPRRQPRKVSYGKSNVTLAGAEAAPIDIFIGNTNPLATPEMIKTVMENSALKLSEESKLEIVAVKCLNNFERDPNPRSKCWKVTVPYAFRDLMENDELYPSGWSHRKFFPPRRNNPSGSNGQQPAKRANIDPIADMIQDARHGSGGQAQHEEQTDLC